MALWHSVCVQIKFENTWYEWKIWNGMEFSMENSMEFYESGLLTMKHLLWPTSTEQKWSNMVKDTFQCKACLVCHSND